MGVGLGLLVSDNVVIVDHGVNEHMLTGVSGNPTEDRIDDLPVFSVFKRLFNSAKQSRDREQKLQGDNCPLIYALKGKDELAVRFSSIKSLNESIPAILSSITTQIDRHFDVILSMPSSSRLADILAKRISRMTGRPHIQNTFAKATNAQAMAHIADIRDSNPKNLSKKDASTLRNVLKVLRERPEELYTAKDVKTSVRKYFLPLVVAQLPSTFDDKTRVLLVDDLLSTGGTLICAHRLLVDSGVTSPHLCVTWFSRAGKKGAP